MGAVVYKAWFEKHRPRTIDDLIFSNTLNSENKSPEYIKNIFKNFYDNEFVKGNVLSYGPGGFGKTSLNKILIGKIVKHPNDIFILGRKVDDVDKLLTWLNASKIKSNQKVVNIEEIDRLSQQAQLVLKDGPLEKYQDKITFLATTNNPEKLDKALVTRFNLRLHFKDLDKNQTIERMKKILISENVKFNENDLTDFVEANLKRGLRELISNLEINSVTGTFVFNKNTSVNFTGNEDYIIQVSEYLINFLKSIDIEKIDSILVNVNVDTEFAKYYNYVVKLLKEDLLLNFDYIYKELIEKDIGFGITSIIIDDYQKLDIVKMKNFHFLGTLSKCFKEIQNVKKIMKG